jgi:hypothetical protein
MSGDDLAYTQAVDLLRDVTHRRIAFVHDRPLPDPALDAEELRAQAQERYESMLRPMEEEVLRVLAGLLRACDYDKVFRAIEEADAGWVRVVMLDWALESLSAEER